MNERIAASPGAPWARWSVVALIAVGAIGGASVRWAAIEAFGSVESSGDWPWAIVVLNAVGALILGAIPTPRSATADATRLRLAVGTGFCGALTTFSTLAVDVAELLRGGESANAPTGLAVVGMSFATGIAAFLLGRRVASVRHHDRALRSSR